MTFKTSCIATYFSNGTLAGTPVTEGGREGKALGGVYPSGVADSVVSGGGPPCDRFKSARRCFSLVTSLRRLSIASA
jgi:hypothetical protein